MSGVDELVYVAMVNDRHADPEPYLFATAEEAIEFARNTARENMRHGPLEESDIDGWLYYATYSVEGDSVWVLAKRIGERDG